MSFIINKRNLSSIGEIILYHRKKGNFSRSELADMAGVSQTVIYEVEHGKITIQSEVLFKILDALNIQTGLNSPFMNEFKKRNP